ncbi:MAG: DUF3857 domain-containing protein [Sphingobacteriaceae bacterium]|nr:MAG: DUF3857 domain-containing protein [Sphingobacteriaceae bacterium]
MIKKITSVIALVLLTKICCAQLVQSNALTQPFGKISQADLDMKQCDFEKDANAMVLFDCANVFFDQEYNVIMDVHKRIKIFNDKAAKEANIRLEYSTGIWKQNISGIQAETINSDNGELEIVKVDRKNIYTEVVDKNRQAIVFTFPKVKAGTVIEFKYRWNLSNRGYIPGWWFQSHIPTRYSSLETIIPRFFDYNKLVMVNHPFTQNTENMKVMVNIPSLNNEPYMTSRKDNLDGVYYELAKVNYDRGYTVTIADTWDKVGKQIMEYTDFGEQLTKKLSNEDSFVAKAKNLKTDEEKIAYIYKQVKSTLKWNHVDRFYTNDGTTEAWAKKTGNSTEINLILYHLLKLAGINAYPMVLSTRDNGKVNPAYPNYNQFNRTVVFIPVDSEKNWVLDATNNLNCYKQIPEELLNTYGLCMKIAEHRSELIFLNESTPARQEVNITAEIKPEGKMDGFANIRSFAYQKFKSLASYQQDGEKKYADVLRSNDQNLKIEDLKLENIESDSLPLLQKVKFKLDLAGSDDHYIYFNPNLFATLSKNPFLDEKRVSSIDFGCLNDYIIGGNYKIPAGYVVEVLPSNTSLQMPDKSIVFKRILIKQDDTISIRYVLSYNKAIYYAEEYAGVFAFQKKLYQMLNEQIVLKKS